MDLFHLFMKQFLIFLFSWLSLQLSAQSLFTTPGREGHPYRIPAIATTGRSGVLAVGDFRWCGSDIGYGHIDLVGRLSSDGGQTWGAEFPIAVGSGVEGSDDCGYGDAAICADAASDRVLLLCASGNTVYFQSTREHPIRVARLYSEDGGKTWSHPEDITQIIYDLVPQAKGLFFGSGKICQSRVVKVGQTARLYAALATTAGNYVVYSDDFGQHWSLLGDAVSPAPAGDEPKCEELPDGTVILSSRKAGGRWFNLFRYTDIAKADGHWQTAVASDKVPGGLTVGHNACNGEILLVPALRRSDRQTCWLLLQSIPLGPLALGDENRSNVAIFYKEVTSADAVSPATLAAGWTLGMTFRSPQGGYSTMSRPTADGTIPFFYETAPGQYSLVHERVSILELTHGLYEAAQ